MLVTLHTSDRQLYTRLTGRSLPLVVGAAVCGLIVMVMLPIGKLILARATAALGVAAVIWGWGVAQYPVLLPGTSVTLSNAGAPHTTLVAVEVLACLVVVLIVPSFILLFNLQQRQQLKAEPMAAATPSAAESLDTGDNSSVL